jgi:uncharacterized protein YxjI
MCSTKLSPIPKPVAIFHRFIAQKTETLALKEKISLHGDSFEVKLASGQPILRVEGKFMTISGRKSVYDMASNHLFDIVKEHLHLHTTFAAHDHDGNRLLEVKSNFKCTYFYYILASAIHIANNTAVNVYSFRIQSHRNIHVPENRQNRDIENERQLAG